jgi:outer membrane lipopolysaccharide assembly protein LptE/RlpB
MRSRLPFLKRQDTSTLGNLARYRHFFRLTTIALSLLLLLTACGYRFSGGGSLPGGVSEVALGVFDNRSGETGVEGIISNDLIYEFTRNGKRLSHGGETADAILSGTVLSVTTASVSRKDANSVLERRVTMSMSLKLVDMKGAVVWEASGLSESEEYEVASDRGTTERNKRQAITELSVRLAEKAYSRMTEDF